MDYGSLIDEFLGRAVKDVELSGVWREDPVDLVTFFESEDYTGEKLFPKQREVIKVIDLVIRYKILCNPEDRRLIPVELATVNEINIVFGKGAGKDFLASRVLAYCCYIICCLKDPQQYFKFGKGEPVDFLNVAKNSTQANSVFFKKFKAALKSCKKFKESHRVEPESPFEYQVLKDQVKFYKNITAHSKHSQAGSWEGMNPLVVIYDEIDDFDNGTDELAYDVGKSSAKSRYNNDYLLIFISYPRKENGFILKKHEEAQTDPNIWSMKASTFDVRPDIKRESMAKEEKNDPEKFNMFYLCVDENTKVYTNRGTISVKDVQAGDKISTGFGKTNKVKNVYNNGEREVICIKTDSGREIKCTPDHLLMYNDGIDFKFKPACEFEVGSYLPIDRSIRTSSENSLYLQKFLSGVEDNKRVSKSGVPKRMSPQLAELLGYMLTNAVLQVDKKGRRNIVVRYLTTNNPDILIRHCELYRDVFGELPLLVDKNDFRVSRLKYIYIHNPKMIDLFLSLGTCQNIFTFLSNVTVPDYVTEFDTACASAFLSGFLFDHSKMTNKGIEIHLQDSKSTDNIAYLFGLLGIVTIRKTDPKDSSFFLKVYYSNVSLAIKRILFYRSKLRVIKKEMPTEESSFEVVPNMIEYIKRTALDIHPHRKKDRIFKTNLCHNPQTVVLHKSLVKYAKIGKLEELRKFLDYRFSFDKIVSIESCGTSVVYDLEIDSEEVSWFIANDFIVHNCKPPKQSQALFAFPEKIYDCVVRGKDNCCVVEDTIITRTLHTGEEKNYVGLTLYNLDLDPNLIYYMGGDGGVDGDSFTLSLFHGEPVLITTTDENGQPYDKWVNKPVEDLMLRWKPNRSLRIPVDVLNVAEIMEQICQKVFVKKYLSDKYNSAQIIQSLQSLGCEAEDKVFSNPLQYKLYTNFKTLVYSKFIELLDIDWANQQMQNIKLINGIKIDHDDNEAKKGDITKAKDISDSRVTAAWLCSSDEPEEFTHSSSPDIFGVII